MARTESTGSSYHGMEKEAGLHVNEVHPDVETQRKKLILCFDGTSNQFQGDDSDTNVVKVYQMFDRSDKHQYHYYQPGIGTYRTDSLLQNSQSTNFFARAYSAVRSKADEAFASTFAEHVMAGYKFLMRYYMEGDKIYIFGFSRGAYTARFLCELIDKIGLLSKGNEEMVPFIWYRYLESRALPKDKGEDIRQKMRQTFCRENVSIFWLGLWDCVASVAQLVGRNAPRVDESSPNIAKHVRHAVSCHERRVKFKPTLFIEEENKKGSFRETWFAGNHGDVGGGWLPNHGMLLSDLALIWMVKELMQVEEGDDLPVSWMTCTRRVEHGKPAFYTPKGFQTVTAYAARRQTVEDAMTTISQNPQPNLLRHDPLDSKRCGSGFAKVGMLAVWWLMELLPLRHASLTVRPSNEWTRIPVNEHGRDRRKGFKYESESTIKPNLGHYRSIPLNPDFHWSVKRLHDAHVIDAMPMSQFGPDGYKAVLEKATVVNGRPASSQTPDQAMFID